MHTELYEPPCINIQFEAGGQLLLFPFTDDETEAQRRPVT